MGFAARVELTGNQGILLLIGVAAIASMVSRLDRSTDKSEQGRSEMALKEYKPGIGNGVSVGRAPGSPITALCGPPFEFTGTILSVTADISGQLLHDTKEEEKAFPRVAMARQ
jgi:hypothetical protein